MNINELGWNDVNWLRIGTTGGLLWTRLWNFGFRKMGELLTRRATLLLSRKSPLSHAQWLVDDLECLRLCSRGQGTVGAWHKQFLFSTASEMLCSPSICGCRGHFLLHQRLDREFFTHIRLLTRLKGMRPYVNAPYVFMRWCLIKHGYMYVRRTGTGGGHLQTR